MSSSCSPSSYTRRSFVYRRLVELGGRFAAIADTAVVASFEGRDDEAECAARLGLVDLSPLPRVGFKGPGMAQWLSEQGIEVPAESNQALARDDGALIARLSPVEILLLGNLKGDGEPCDRLQEAWEAKADAQACYPVPRRDSHHWFIVCGEHAVAMLAKLCAVDLRGHRFADYQIAQTSVARLSSVIIREYRHGVPAYHLLADSASAEYMWNCLMDAMAEFQGRAIGMIALQGLG